MLTEGEVGTGNANFRIAKAGMDNGKIAEISLFSRTDLPPVGIMSRQPAPTEWASGFSA